MADQTDQHVLLPEGTFTHEEACAVTAAYSNITIENYQGGNFSSLSGTTASWSSVIGILNPMPGIG